MSHLNYLANDEEINSFDQALHVSQAAGAACGADADGHLRIDLRRQLGVELDP